MAAWANLIVACCMGGDIVDCFTSAPEVLATMMLSPRMSCQASKRISVNSPKATSK